MFRRTIPDYPASRASKKTSAPVPMGETTPSPVIATRREPANGLSLVRVPSQHCVHKYRDVVHRSQIAALLGQPDRKLVLQFEHELDCSQGIDAQIPKGLTRSEPLHRQVIFLGQH